MKSKVKLSQYSLGVTLTITALLTAMAVYGSVTKEMPLFWIAICILLIIFIFTLLYAPCKIEVTDKNIIVKSFLKNHKIPMHNVVSVEKFMPTMGAISILASGGFYGFWGIFREGDAGRYVAYYGKSSDCFMLRMKNGDKYVIGCENPQTMIEYINSQLK